jgi:guanylate kinase
MSYRAEICRQIIELDEARETKLPELKDLQGKIELIKVKPSDNKVIFYTPYELQKLLSDLIENLEEKEEQIKNLIRIL